MIRRRKAVNYLSNKELLREIHKSKATYCEYESPEYVDYDIIVENISQMKATNLNKAKKNRAARLNEQMGDKLFLENDMTNKEVETYVKKNGIKPSAIKDTDIVVRVMTNEHVPEMRDKKDKIVKCPVNFPPFLHYTLRNKKWTVVGKSHHKNGKFTKEGGQCSRKLAMAYMQLVNKFSNKSNWRNYTWLSEMTGQALARLAQVGLQFNEMKSDNPFAYFTQITTHSFTFVLNKEKEHLSIRNKLIQESGYNPNFNEQAQRDQDNYMRDNAPMLVKSDE